MMVPAVHLFQDVKDVLKGSVHGWLDQGMA